MKECGIYRCFNRFCLNVVAHKIDLIKCHSNLNFAVAIAVVIFEFLNRMFFNLIAII